MDNANGDKPRPQVAPPEPISPALTALAKPASPTRAPTPESARAPAHATTSPAPDSNKDKAPANSSLGASSTPAPRPVSIASAPRSPLPGASTPAPVINDRAPSPAPAPANGIVNKTSPAAATQPTVTTSPKQVNGRKVSFGEADAESELSEPASTVHSPSGVEFNELEDEIVVGERVNGVRRSSPLRTVSDPEDETMADADDEPVTSHYPKRKRTSLFNDLSESKIEPPKAAPEEKAPAAAPTKPRAPARQSLGSVKGVTIGYWRDSPAPVENLKHAVIGFIDVRERLRTRIQPITLAGDPVPEEYPLPPGPGGSWVTFERVVFNKYLVGLDHFQVKEFVRVRADSAGSEATEEERIDADKAAVKEAIRRVKSNPTAENATNPPQIAYGPELPDHLLPSRDPKRRRTSGGFATANPAPTNGLLVEHTPIQPAPGGPQPVRNVIDPLNGTRPTRILIGHWAKSAESDVMDRHAVYGILGQNDMFRVKLVRETRDGRFVDGNFPQGAGALWIAYEEVAFEPHLQHLQRNEIKEYCRVRQWQIDHGESAEERAGNEAKAVYEAQARVAGTSFKPAAPLSIAPALPRPPMIEEFDDSEQNGRTGFGGHELRQSRRVEAARAENAARTENRPSRQMPVEAEPRVEPRPAANKAQGGDALERTSSLARREIARVEAAQGRADRHAANRERAAAAAADAANAAAAAIPAAAVNGRTRFHETDEMQRLNKVWARQESLRLKAGPDDSKIYNGVKYERKANGPFTGKLVSQGTIISIDGEDFVEYRVLTKPSFF
ncbi:hypothetical protein FZEAL_4144 [Fusarium zealandicum]|uniref:Uncharacterized protein n=1 Tax=Fusarium zealandicum TaxID=1053134 RepID=A0A8H4XLW7_9HYPO|nr:hypothetical protein FZEAL_4144 [Fusarium zealandicum]